MAGLTDFVSSTLSAGIDSTQTALVLNGATGFPIPSTIGEGKVAPYFVGIWDAAESPEFRFDSDLFETVLVTSVASTTLTIIRGQGRTSGIEHSAGATVSILADAQNIGSGWALNAESFLSNGNFGTTADHTTGFKAACDLAQVSGLPLYIPAGEYNFTTWGSEYDQSGDLRMYGDSGRSILKGQEGSGSIFINVKGENDFLAQGITFQLWKSVCHVGDLAENESSKSIVFRGCGVEDGTHSIIEFGTAEQAGTGIVYAEVSDCSYECVAPEAPIISVPEIIGSMLISDNRFRSTGTSTTDNAIVVGSESYASQDKWKQVRVLNNRFEVNLTASTGESAIRLYGKGHVVRGNILSSGSNIDSYIHVSGRNCVVSDNVVQPSADQVGIKMSGDYSGESSVNCHGCTVSGNSIHGDGDSTGIFVLTGGSISVTGNSVYSCKKGVVIGDAASAGEAPKNIVVASNTIDAGGLKEADGEDGLSVIDCEKGLRIYGNTIVRYHTGISIGSSTSMSFADISHNFIGGFYSVGIDISAASDKEVDQVVITCNSIESSQGSTTGMHSSGEGTLENFCVMGNLIDVADVDVDWNLRPSVSGWFDAGDADETGLLSTVPGSIFIQRNEASTDMWINKGTTGAAGWASFTTS